jgi:hypothetical protein
MISQLDHELRCIIEQHTKHVEGPINMRNADAPPSCVAFALTELLCYNSQIDKFL